MQPISSQDLDEMRKGFRLSAFLPFRMNRLAERLTRDVMPVYRDSYGLTRPEWRVLAHLGACGANTARDLVGLTALDKVQVSRAVAQLDKRGWLTREVDAEDRRVSLLTLTAQGQAAFEDLMPMMMAKQSEMLAAMDARQREAVERAICDLERALGIACRYDQGAGD